MSEAPVRVVSVGTKSLGVAYAWWLLGFFGAHQFYLGKTGRGALYVVTLGGFMFAWLMDFFTLPTQVRRVNRVGY